MKSAECEETASALKGRVNVPAVDPALEGRGLTQGREEPDREDILRTSHHALSASASPRLRVPVSLFTPSPIPRPPMRFLAVAVLLAVSLLVSAALASDGLRVLSSSRAGGLAGHDATPYLGMTYVPLSHELATRYGVELGSGVLVTDVQDGSPARMAGLRRGDILLSADSVSLTRVSSLVQLLLERRPGDRVSFELLREGSTLTLELVLGARPR